MIVTSKKSRDKMFHDTKMCSCYKRIKPDNFKQFTNVMSAVDRGYYPCNKSNRLYKTLDNNLEYYEFLMSEYGICMIKHRGNLYLFTNHSEYKMTYSYGAPKKSKKKILLYHVNHKDTSYKVRNPYEIACIADIENKVGYHRQKTDGVYSLGDLIIYIEEHDHWRSSREKRKEEKNRRVYRKSERIMRDNTRIIRRKRHDRGAMKKAYRMKKIVEEDE